MADKKHALPGQYLTFSLNGQPYGIAIHTIREINRIAEITAVPQSNDYVAGIMNLRGKVIPVINLRKKLGFPVAADTKQTCVIVIDAADGQVGTIVDAVNSVCDFTAEQIEPAPNVGAQGTHDFIYGVGKQEKAVVILLDIVAAVSHDPAVFSAVPKDKPAA